MEVRGARGAGTAGYLYALTDLGRDRARQYLAINQYTGAAPVPLSAYVAQLRAQMAVRGYLDHERLKGGFSHLIISDDMLEQLGPAVNAGKAVFLYGPPGNGKTVIAEGMGQSIGGDMYMPYAIDVNGQIITMYDPIAHEPLDEDQQTSGVIESTPFDRRWVRIKRPVVITGGELMLDMLDLRYNPTSKYYEAPLQLKANGGVFLIDDFGRQRVSAQDILNRWIVPLESRVDYLTLHTGKKFQVPFDVLVVLATHLDPSSLADEAFLRRIPYKIPVGDPTLDQYTQIFELNCRRRSVAFDPVMIEHLLRNHYGPNNKPLRACHPRDLLDQVTVITRELLDIACATYFVNEDTPSAPTHARMR
jgi:hypothetical protein